MRNLRQLVRWEIAPLIVSVLSAHLLGADDSASPQGLPNYGEFRPQQSESQAPPTGAIVLFDGDVNRFVSRTGEQVDWPVKDGTLVSTPSGKNSNHIVSQIHFRDADLHAEFMLPEKGGGNSGLYLHGNYELQIFNSYGKDQLDDHSAGAIYGFSKPAVNAVRKPGEWQVYDIRYLAPRRDKQGKIVTEGSITAWLNGKEVQHETRFGEPRSAYHPYRYQSTPYLQAIGQRQKKTMVGPLFLQDHNNPVRFRNVWVRPLDDQHLEYTPSK